MLKMKIALTYLQNSSKGTKKPSAPWGKHAESENSINLSSYGVVMMMMMMTMMVTMTATMMVMTMTMTMIMTMMTIMDHICIYILKVHRHGISKLRSPSALPARSNVRVAPKIFKHTSGFVLHIYIPRAWVLIPQLVLLTRQSLPPSRETFQFNAAILLRPTRGDHEKTWLTSFEPQI